MLDYTLEQVKAKHQTHEGHLDGDELMDLSLLESFWLVAKISIPPILSMFFMYFVQLTSIYYVGHLDDAALMAGVGLGNMLTNILCFAITQGLNSALESLISQAYGFGKYRVCGMYLNKGRVIVTTVLIPIALIFFASDSILIAIGQDEEISRISRIYVTCTLPGVWAMTQFDAIRKFLIAQRKSTIPFYTQVITSLLHFVWC